MSSSSITTESRIFEGSVYHARMVPKVHAFGYQIFMMYLNLDGLDSMLSLSPFWSKSWWAIARFRRSDFHGNPAKPLKEEVIKTVNKELNDVSIHQVCMLANFRYFGIQMNPLVNYYCFDENEQLVAILAEVSNTPWKEKHAYVIPAKINPINDDIEPKPLPSTSAENKLIQHRFSKVFTVSPFNPINMHYHWTSNIPAENLHLDISVRQDTLEVMRAVLDLKATAISVRSLNRIILHYPIMTIKILLGIYWQALNIYFKKVPFLGKNKLCDL